jgi:hypothetical protein
VVSEAWIDEFGKWVVLDGQNGAYWSFDTEPMATLDLQQALADGRQPRLLAARGPRESRETAWWMTYFRHVTTTGATWARPPFIPHFQNELHPSQMLVRFAEDAYPDLAEIGVSMDVRDEAAALRFVCRHPYATGYLVQHNQRHEALDAADPVWRLPQTTGPHTATVSVRTPWADLAPQPLSFHLNE